MDKLVSFYGFLSFGLSLFLSFFKIIIIEIKNNSYVICVVFRFWKF